MNWLEWLTGLFTKKPPKPVPTPAPQANLIVLHNQFRQKNGKPILAGNTELNAAALAHATDMDRNGFCDHVGSDGSTFIQRIIRAGFVSTTGNPKQFPAAENVAEGYPDNQSVMTAWENSLGHRSNILSDNIFIGTAHVGQSYCVVFAR